MAGRDLRQNGFDPSSLCFAEAGKVRDKVRDPSSLCFAEAGKVSLSDGPA